MKGIKESLAIGGAFFIGACSSVPKSRLVIDREADQLLGIVNVDIDGDFTREERPHFYIFDGVSDRVRALTTCISNSLLDEHPDGIGFE